VPFCFRPRNRLLRHPIDGIVRLIGTSVPVRCHQPVAGFAIGIAERRRRIARRLQRRHAVHLVVSRSDRCAPHGAVSETRIRHPSCGKTSRISLSRSRRAQHALAVVVILTYPRGGASRSTVKAPVERGDSLDQVTGSGVCKAPFGRLHLLR